MGTDIGEYRCLWKDTAAGPERRRMIAALRRAQGVHRKRDAVRRTVWGRMQVPAGIMTAGLTAWTLGKIAEMAAGM